MIKKGDWLWDGNDTIGQAHDNQYEVLGADLGDIVFYAHNGDRRGRISKPQGGPRNYEPACAAANWKRIQAPTFPLNPRKYLTEQVRPITDA